MTGTLVVNNLAGLDDVHLVIGHLRQTLHRLLLVVRPAITGAGVDIFYPLTTCWMQNNCGWWSISAFFTKVLMVPLIMGYAFRKNGARGSGSNACFGPAALVLMAAGIVLLCWFVVRPVQLPLVAQLKPALAVALGHFLLGYCASSANVISCARCLATA